MAVALNSGTFCTKTEQEEGRPHAYDNSIKLYFVYYCDEVYNRDVFSLSLESSEDPSRDMTVSNQRDLVITEHNHVYISLKFTCVTKSQHLSFHHNERLP